MAGKAKKEPKKKKEEVVVEPVSRVSPTEAPVTVAAKNVDEEEIAFDFEKAKKSDRYFEGVGRRKTAVARVRMYTKPGDIVVNEKPYHAYFPTLDVQHIVEDALQKMKLLGRFRVSVRVKGGGPHSQAEAVRHGLARALIIFNADFRKRLKRAGFLRRDPRAKERKKFGLKRARRAPQWQKR